MTENRSLRSASHLPGSGPSALGLEQAPKGTQAARAQGPGNRHPEVWVRGEVHRAIQRGDTGSKVGKPGQGTASHRGQGGPGEPQRAAHTGLAGDTWVLQSLGPPHIGHERTRRQGPGPHHHPLCSAVPRMGHHGEDTFLSIDNHNDHHRTVSKGALAGAFHGPGPVLSAVHTLETR